MSSEKVQESNSQVDEEAMSELAISDSETRRNLMKKIGTVSSAGLVGSIAGCTSGDGGGDTKGKSKKTKMVKLLMAPSGFQGIVMDHLFQDTKILYNEFEESGLDVKLSKSWEGAAIFTAGGADYETFGSLEAAMIAAERKIPLTVNANLAPQFILITTEKGSEYDPANTGSAQASVDKLAKKNATFALAGWGGATATAIVLAMKEAFNKTFVDDPKKSDFKITTAEWFAIPKLISRGDAAAGTNSPVHGMASFMVPDKEMTKLFQIGSILEEEGLGVPQMNGWTCSQKFTNKWPKASPALVQAYHQGMSWFFEAPMDRIKEDQKHHLEQIGMTSLEQAKWTIDWGINMSLDNELPIVYKDVELTDKFIKSDKKFLKKSEESGFLSSGWQKRLNYRKVSQTNSGTSTSS